jgi:hypothetical protein
VDGRLPLIFTAGKTPGAAAIDALAEGGLVAHTTIPLAEATASAIALTAVPVDLRDVPEAALTAVVRFADGSAAAGEKVRLSVSDDEGAKGTIAGGEVFEGATDKMGRLTIKFKKTPGAQGTVVVRAELLGDGGGVRQEDSVVLYLSQPPPGLQIYLPAVLRGAK